MLTKLALLFVIHVLGLGVLFARYLDPLKLSKLRWVFLYLVLFYLSFGFLFSTFPNLIQPELISP